MTKFYSLGEYDTFRFRHHLWLKGKEKALNLTRLQYGETEVRSFDPYTDVEPEQITEIYTENGKA